jgi:hypothetical protein
LFGASTKSFLPFREPQPKAGPRSDRYGGAFQRSGRAVLRECRGLEGEGREDLTRPDRALSFTMLHRIVKDRACGHSPSES